MAHLPQVQARVDHNAARPEETHVQLSQLRLGRQVEAVLPHHVLDVEAPALDHVRALEDLAQGRGALCSSEFGDGEVQVVARVGLVCRDARDLEVRVGAQAGLLFLGRGVVGGEGDVERAVRAGTEGGRREVRRHRRRGPQEQRRGLHRAGLTVGDGHQAGVAHEGPGPRRLVAVTPQKVVHGRRVVVA